MRLTPELVDLLQRLKDEAPAETPDAAPDPQFKEQVEEAIQNAKSRPRAIMVRLDRASVVDRLKRQYRFDDIGKLLAAQGTHAVATDETAKWTALSDFRRKLVEGLGKYSETSPLALAPSSEGTTQSVWPGGPETLFLAGADAKGEEKKLAQLTPAQVDAIGKALVAAGAKDLEEPLATFDREYGLEAETKDEG